MINRTIDHTTETVKSAVVVLYDNLRTVYANFDRIKDILKQKNRFNFVIVENLFTSVISGCRSNSKLSPDDKIKSIVMVFKNLVDYFPEFTKELFKGYREGPKIYGSYVNVYEVEEFCRNTEPKILKAIK